MSHGDDEYARALAAAVRHSTAWLGSLPDRRVGPVAAAHDLAEAFGGPLPRGGMPAEEVVDLLAATAEPGLMAMPSGRFFGWVIGGSLPAALASDWLVSAWDQNAGLRYATPAMAARSSCVRESKFLRSLIISPMCWCIIVHFTIQINHNYLTYTNNSVL